MSYLDTILKGVLVERKVLSEVASIYDGTHQTPKYTNSGVPFVSVQNIKDLYATKKCISIEDFEKYKYKPQKDDIFMTRIGDIGTCAIVKDDRALAYYVTLTLIRVNQSIILPKFLKYVIESRIGKEELYKRTLVNATPIKINLGEIGKIVIPIPPLIVQNEIVRLLDSFIELKDELIAELTTELKACKEQFKYYRDKLLSFKDSEVIWKTLGDLAVFRRGSFPQPYGNSDWYDGEGAMPFVQVVDVGHDMQLVSDTKNKISKLAQPKSVFVPKDTVIVTLQGSIGRVAITQYDSYVDRTLAIFEQFQIEIDKKYFAYQLQEKFRVEKETARGDIIKTITKEDFKTFKIPIPSLEVQKETVSILDALTEKTEQISSELTAELTAREKQYEYYRDLLLTFPKNHIE